MTDVEHITLEAEFLHEDAERDIAKAVGARHTLARKYVRRVRRRHPGATPAEVIKMLERHYVTAITVAGGIVTVGAIAVDVGIAMIPGGGVAAAGAKNVGAQAAKTASKEVAKKAAQEAAKQAAKETAKAVAKGAALNAARSGAQRVAALFPAGDRQLQFEITAIFALATADIHGMALDQDQAHALVYGLSNGRVSQQQIAAMATDLASMSTGGIVGVGDTVAYGRKDWSHWANTLADTLPGGAAQHLVRTVQTGQLETVRAGLSGQQQAAIEYGVGALTGGVTRFVFGREVVDAAKAAFAEAPSEFPDHLAVPAKVIAEDEEDEPNRALAALEDAAKSIGTWVSDAADSATRAFRRVDRDGDGVPDEPQALTAVKGVGGAIAGVAGTVGDGVTSLFRSKRQAKHAAGKPRPEIEPTDD